DVYPDRPVPRPGSGCPVLRWNRRSERSGSASIASRAAEVRRPPPGPALCEISQFCDWSRSRTSQIPVFSGSLGGAALAHCRPEMLKIQRSVRAGYVRIALSGRIEREHLTELQRLIDESAPHKRVTLGLEDVRLLDREVVRFLARCEGTGIRLKNCSPYVREWISREENEHANP